jgi:hypothetical protein
MFGRSAALVDTTKRAQVVAGEGSRTWNRVACAGGLVCKAASRPGRAPRCTGRGDSRGAEAGWRAWGGRRALGGGVRLGSGRRALQAALLAFVSARPRGEAFRGWRGTGVWICRGCLGRLKERQRWRHERAAVLRPAPNHQGRSARRSAGKANGRERARVRARQGAGGAGGACVRAGAWGAARRCGGREGTRQRRGRTGASRPSDHGGGGGRGGRQRGTWRGRRPGGRWGRGVW